MARSRLYQRANGAQGSHQCVVRKFASFVHLKGTKLIFPPRLTLTIPERTYAIADMRLITSSPMKLSEKASVMFANMIGSGSFQPVANSVSSWGRTRDDGGVSHHTA